ncbi:hypothetical protein [Acinetobacter towneri]|uniref:hypothetical protein n=1 Tax=Acinetobacter towneri TaxID=202956 RepID=UPI003A873E75
MKVASYNINEAIVSLLIITFLLALADILNSCANLVEATSSILLAINILLENELVTKLLSSTFNL